MTEGPVVTFQEVDARLRVLMREVAKCRTQTLQIFAAFDTNNAANGKAVAAHVLQRLDHMVSLLEVPGLTRYRQARAVIEPPWEPPGAPDDLCCKLCGEEKPSEEFFFDDGQGHYGFTGRCATCRSLPKRERQKIAERRGLTRSARERAVGKRVGS